MNVLFKNFTLLLCAGLITVGTFITLSKMANYRGLLNELDVPHSKLSSIVEIPHLITPEIITAIMSIERDAVLPHNAESKGFYTRFYALDEEGPPTFIRGVFIYPAMEKTVLRGADEYGNEKFISEFIQKTPNQNIFIQIPKLPNVYFVKANNLPLIMDGGCSVIIVEYDLDKKMLLWTKEVIHKLGQNIATERIVHGFCNGHA